MKTDPDLPAFVARLEREGLLVRVARPTSLVHEITEIHRRVLADWGSALLFERPVRADGSTSTVPLLVNLFGTQQRIELGFGTSDLAGLGEMLAFLRHPEPPGTMRAALEAMPALRAALSLGTRKTGRLACQEKRLVGEDADLGILPVQWCWQGEPAPLITWPMVITRAPDDPDDVNVGIYRMQVLGPRALIVRWLAQRGGARHHRLWKERGLPMPVAVVVGADPATLLSAVMPLPDGMSELDFSGVIRGEKLRVGSGITVDLPIPASTEIVVEGLIAPDNEADEGPYGDHTGYYNAVERFPVMDVTAITTRASPIYLSTYTGRPPDEPSILGETMAKLFVPLVRRQFPEVRDIHLPPEACSYRAMVVAIDKRYPGQARRVMMGLWSMLPQFSYTKLIIVVDGDIDIRSWPDVIWAISTRFDASRDLMVVNDTPIDYLDFASPRPGLGGKLGLDATGKLGAETQREWGRPLAMSEEVMRRVDGFWTELGLGEEAMNQRVVVGISGASGALLGTRIVELLEETGRLEIHLVVSTAAEATIAHEVGPTALATLTRRASVLHPINAIGASIASGSFVTSGMIVAPCSMRTLGAIATSLSDNLLVRAADVHLKERRRLVLLARETPLHLGHLRSMLAVTEMGAIVAPPVPAFYRRPQTVADIVDATALRAIDLLGLDLDLDPHRWAGLSPP